MGSGPLQGLRVLEFSQIIAGPVCGMLLSHMGAEVIKFEPLEGEPLRTTNQLVPGEARGFAVHNLGKQSVAIDLRRPEAQEVVRRLVPLADVVVINYRPGVAEELGLDYDTLAPLNPRLVYCENTAWGKVGPRANLGGFDILVQAFSGLMAGDEKSAGGVPAPIVPLLADYTSGLLMACSISAALRWREVSGVGQRIDCTMLGAALLAQVSYFNWFDAFDSESIPAFLGALGEARARGADMPEQVQVRRRHRPLPSGNIYYRVYQTADGYMAMGAYGVSLYRSVLAATGLKDPRLVEGKPFVFSPPGWDAEGPRLIAEAEALFRSRTTAEWLTTLEAHRVPAAPVQFVEELFDHPQVLANGLQVELEHPLLGPLKTVGAPFRMSATPPAVQGPSPVLGASSDEVLALAGYGAEGVAALRAAGVIL